MLLRDLEDDDLDEEFNKQIETARVPRKIEKPTKKKHSEAYEYLKIVVIGIVIAVCINKFVIVNADVPTESMESTIMTGDRLIGFRLAYLFSSPQRGDIVIFHNPDNESELFVKRVIGLPGETIEIVKGTVFITKTDGTTFKLEEDYLNEAPAENDYGPYSVPDDCYFMMGDNRNHSGDAREWENKYVNKSKIVAKVLFKYWKGFSLIN